jgi:hypothetical protein
MNVDIFSALLTAAATVFVALLGIIPTLLKFSSDQKRHRDESADAAHRDYLQLSAKMDEHIDADDANRKEVRESLESIHITNYRRDIFDKNLPLAIRVKSGIKYLELCGGHNGEAEIQHKINVKNLQKKLEMRESGESAN